MKYKNIKTGIYTMLKQILTFFFHRHQKVQFEFVPPVQERGVQLDLPFK